MLYNTEHDCIQELRNELNLTKVKTAWSVSTIKLNNIALLNEINNENQEIIIHYSGEKEIMKKLMVKIVFLFV